MTEFKLICSLLEMPIRAPSSDEDYEKHAGQQVTDDQLTRAGYSKLVVDGNLTLMARSEANAIKVLVVTSDVPSKELLGSLDVSVLNIPMFGKVWQVTAAVVFKQGQGVGAQAYRALLSNGRTLMTDLRQTAAGAKLWLKAIDSGTALYAYDRTSAPVRIELTQARELITTGNNRTLVIARGE